MGFVDVFNNFLKTLFQLHRWHCPAGFGQTKCLPAARPCPAIECFPPGLGRLASIFTIFCDQTVNHFTILLTCYFFYPILPIRILQAGGEEVVPHPRRQTGGKIRGTDLPGAERYDLRGPTPGRPFGNGAVCPGRGEQSHVLPQLRCHRGCAALPSRPGCPADDRLFDGGPGR